MLRHFLSEDDLGPSEPLAVLDRAGVMKRIERLANAENRLPGQRAQLTWLLEQQ